MDEETNCVPTKLTAASFTLLFTDAKNGQVELLNYCLAPTKKTLFKSNINLYFAA
jgi:hypothetical protein